MKVKIKRLTPTAHLPAYQSDGAAGADLYADLDAPLTIQPGETALIPTGLALECPSSEQAEPNVVILLFARSGLAVKRGLGLANGVGVVDPDYRGEVKVALHHHGTEPYTVLPGERVAQMAFLPLLRTEFEEADSLSDTERGAGGFGHTGV